MIKYILLLSLSVACFPAMQAQSLDLPQDEPVRYLALGDSYTIGQGVTLPERWPEQLRDSLEAAGYEFDTLNTIAATGWNTGSLLNNIRGKGLADEYNLVSILIGVNNQFQGGSVMLYAEQFEQVLDSAIVYAGGNSQAVFVLSIPDYAYTPVYENDPEISQEIDQFNTVNRLICEDRNIPYFNITPISRSNDPALIANDGFHASGYQYGLWVKEIMVDIPRLILTAAVDDNRNDWAVYPMPVSDRMIVEIPDEVTQQTAYLNWTLIDASGRNVAMKQTLQESTFDLVVPAEFPNGMYFLQARHDGQLYFSRKLMLLR